MTGTPLLDRVALVTGGASGIGQACCELFTQLGALAFSLDVDAHASFVADVAEGAGVDDAVDAIVRDYGRIDVLVHCAGIGSVGTVESFDEREWERLFAVNVYGIARVTKAALPALRRSRYPSIVLIGSIAGSVGLPSRAAYAASKGAVHALGLAMAADLVQEGIRVNVVAPGTTDTPWVARLLATSTEPAAERRALEARQPFGRLLTASEVAGAVAYLASGASLATTGTILAVDGGMAGLRLRS